jgi:hypothetical protein
MEDQPFVRFEHLGVWYGIGHGSTRDGKGCGVINAQFWRTNPEKAHAFYAIHHVTKEQVKHGVPDMDVEGLEWEDMREQLRAQPEVDWVEEEAVCEIIVSSGAGSLRSRSGVPFESHRWSIGLPPGLVELFSP